MPRSVRRQDNFPLDKVLDPRQNIDEHVDDLGFLCRRYQLRFFHLLRVCVPDVKIWLPKRRLNLSFSFKTSWACGTYI